MSVLGNSTNGNSTLGPLGFLVPTAGDALTKAGTTIQTFLISLASGFVLFGVQFTFFLAVRNYLWAKRI
jgi:hypothetical protein